MSLSGLWTIRGRLSLNIGLTIFGLVAIAGIVLFMVRGQVLDDRGNQVRAVVDMAAGVAADLQKQVEAGKLTKDQAMAQFLATDNALRYDGDNYIAVFDMKGTSLAFPPAPKFVGVNRIDLTDPTASRSCASPSTSPARRARASSVSITRDPARWAIRSPNSPTSRHSRLGASMSAPASTSTT